MEFERNSKVFDLFLHRDLKRDKVAYTKAKVLLVVQVMLCMFQFVYSLYFWSNGFFWGIKSWINYLGIITMFIGLLSLKFYANVTNPFRAIGLMGYISITLGVYEAGGVHSFDMYWYAPLTIGAILFIGYKSAIFFYLLSIVTLATFYYLDIHYPLLFTTTLETHTLQYKMMNVLFITTILSILSLLLIKSNNNLKRIIEQIKEEDVREELAIDFHDRIGNKLASIKHLSNLSRTTSDQELKNKSLYQIEKCSNDLYDDFKDFIWSQRESNNQIVEFTNYIKDFYEEYLELSEIKFYVKILPEELSNYTLSSNFSKEVIPVMKEFVTNSLKHSKATSLYLIIEETASFFKIEVKDNGVGFDISQNKEGNGLMNMSKRMKRVDSCDFKIIAKLAQGVALQILLSKK